MMVAIPDEKQRLRTYFRTQRARLTPDEVETMSLALCRQLLAWFQSQEQINQVFFFKGFREEPRLDQLAFALSPSHILALPVCSKAGGLTFHRWQVEDVLRSNSWGIAEPLAERSQPLAADQNTVILVPCLAADQLGYRLGYGAGYYDRYLNAYPSARTIGILWEQLRSHTPLPREPHDRRLDGVCTEVAFWPPRLSNAAG